MLIEFANKLKEIKGKIDELNKTHATVEEIVALNNIQAYLQARSPIQPRGNRQILSPYLPLSSPSAWGLEYGS